MIRLNAKKQLNNEIQNDDTLRNPLCLNTHPIRSYSDVVAFGNKDNSPANSKVFSIQNQQMSSGNCSVESLEAFPPLTDLESFTSDETDVVILNDSRSSETLEEKLTTYGSYLETRFKVCESEKSETGISLRSILEIEIDDFNFTEVDHDPESSAFPRFVGVFEDKSYLNLEKEVLRSFEKLVF